MSDEITITKKEYLRLLENSLKFEALERVGVDNWDGWSEVNWEKIETRMETEEAKLNT